MEPLNFEHAGRTLRGTVHLPRATPAPVVVLCHGLGGSRLGLGFPELGRRLAGRGIASYRFDFAGFGESEGDAKSFTVSDQVEQVEAVLDDLAGHSAVDAERISVLGLSMGGLTAALVSGRREVRSLVMWAPAAGRFNLPFWLHESRVEELERQGYIDFGGLQICRPFLDDLDTFDQFTAAERHAGPVLLAGEPTTASCGALTSTRIATPGANVWSCTNSKASATISGPSRSGGG